MAYNKWLDSKLAAQGTNLRDFITDLCVVVEKHSPYGWTHKMSPWYSIPSENCIQRVCPCGLNQIITGSDLAQANSAAKMTMLIARLHQDDPWDGQCPVVTLKPTPEGYKPSTGIETILAADSDKGFWTSVVIPEGSTVLTQADIQAAYDKIQKEVFGQQAVVSGLISPEKAVEMLKEHGLPAEEVKSPKKSLKDEYEAQILAYHQIAQKESHGEFPPIEPAPVVGTGSQPPVEPVNAPDIPDDSLADIVAWLEKPWDAFDTWQDWKYRETPLFISNLKLAAAVIEGGKVAPIETTFPDYFRLVIRRELVNLTDGRWWVELAIRQDTGEPIASVNHQGSLTQMLEEMHK